MCWISDFRLNLKVLILCVIQISVRICVKPFNKSSKQALRQISKHFSPLWVMWTHFTHISVSGLCNPSTQVCYWSKSGSKLIIYVACSREGPLARAGPQTLTHHCKPTVGCPSPVQELEVLTLWRHRNGRRRPQVPCDPVVSAADDDIRERGVCLDVHDVEFKSQFVDSSYVTWANLCLKPF